MNIKKTVSDAVNGTVRWAVNRVGNRAVNRAVNGTVRWAVNEVGNRVGNRAVNGAVEKTVNRAVNRAVGTVNAAVYGAVDDALYKEVADER